jgi:flagellar biosynthetic protein FlhB
LARSLYRHLEPGQSIPYDLYAAVAAILAYLYRQQVEERLRRERERAARQDQAAAATGGAPAAALPAAQRYAAQKDAAQANSVSRSKEQA